MGIHFSKERWDKVKEDAERWWAGELTRPLIQVRLGGANPGRPEPDMPNYAFEAWYDDAISAEQIVDRWDWNLSCSEFLGDGFPVVWPNFGPGVMAAFMGAKLEKGEGTVWYHPTEDVPMSDLNFKYDANNKWYGRVKDLCRIGTDRWQGAVQISMTDLGGNLDVLATFRPGEKLLLDLYDDPEAVKARTWEAHDLWWRYYDELNEILQPVNPCYTAWTPLYSSVPFYMLQCDFCYMISPDMFDEFVKPELQASCRKLGNSFYHLDGPGQLPHLDSLLSIPELTGVQWVPGAGAPDETQWPEVYKKIRDAGKLIQLWGGIPALDAVAKQLGTAEGIVTLAADDISKKSSYEDALRRYGAL